MSKPAFVLLMAIVAVFAFVYVSDYLSEENQDKGDEVYGLTFCEKLINTERMVSSSISHPDFDVLPEEIYKKGIASAPVIFDGDYPDAKFFKTRIEEGISHGPNFAGHFTVVEWGCGSNCQSHAVIDNNTGHIVAYGIPSEFGVEYSMESKIIITNPSINMPLLSGSGMAPMQAASTFANISRDYYRMRKYENSGAYSLFKFCTESAGSHYLLNLDKNTI